MRFSDEEKKFLLENYNKYTAKELAKKINRKAQSIRWFFIDRGIEYKKELYRYREGLTDTERKVMDLMSLGWSDVEIAKELLCELNTVRTHKANIYQKSGFSGTDKGSIRVKVVLWYLKEYKGVSL